MSDKKRISIVTPCFNEEANVRDLFYTVKAIMSRQDRYDYEHIFIDNASTDETVGILKSIAAEEKHLKIIVNNRNYGQAGSPYHGMLQASGDAVISLVADFQDPPELIERFIEKWEEGFKIVIGVKPRSKENPLMFLVRRFFYWLMRASSETEQIPNFCGYGLYDKTVFDCLRRFREPVPYFRGLIAELGFPIARIDFVQPKRKGGKTSNNFFTLYDYAMTGFVNYSRLPLRLATFTGFATAGLSMLIALVYFVLKLIFWDTFPIGIVPMVILLCFFSSLQLVFLGILGEYVGAVLTQVKNRPHVIEKERINFDTGEKSD